MRNLDVIVAGHQFAEPAMWILYLADRFKKQPSAVTLRGPDRCLLLDIQVEHYAMCTKAALHPFWDEKESYHMLLTQHADIVLYLQSVITEQLHLMKRDFHIVSRVLAELPRCPPVFTLLNDSYCGSGHGTFLSEEELKNYVIPGSRVFRTAIGYRPRSGNCSIGADEVFDALLAVCNDMSI